MTLRVLFIDGVHSHDTWPETGRCLREQLAGAGPFQVQRLTAPEPEQFVADLSTFAAYDVVIPYYCPVPGPDRDPAWPAATRAAFEAYVQGGGGLVIVHAASNAFASWPGYNRMTGLGGWGGRGPDAGPYTFVGERGELIRADGEGPAGHHEPEFEYVIDVRAPEHPITRGMPPRWLHTLDEAYALLRGPGEQLEVLATAFSGKTPAGSQRHEPMAMTIGYGQGRVFHTTLGHGMTAIRCVGFQTLLLRGTEWAATGAVTQPLPADFPTERATSSRV